jgi:hypothetical protein
MLQSRPVPRNDCLPDACVHSCLSGACERAYLSGNDDAELAQVRVDAPQHTRVCARATHRTRARTRKHQLRVRICIRMHTGASYASASSRGGGSLGNGPLELAADARLLVAGVLFLLFLLLLTSSNILLAAAAAANPLFRL